MKQKIKKLIYTIPLESDYVHSGSIVVSAFDIPGNQKKGAGGVSIKVQTSDNSKDIAHTEASIVIPRRQVKQLRKALKKICKGD